MSKISIGNRLLGGNNSPLIVAELSANHNGSLERALETIEAAHKAGACAVKLQTYSADTITIDCDRPEFMIKGGLWNGYKLYDLYKWAETPFEWHKTLFDHARNVGINIFSTPFDETAVDLLVELNTPLYKIASCENIDLPLIEYVAKKGKPMLISTGMASEQEIEEAVNAARGGGCKDLVLLHCVSCYPTPNEEANLRKIVELNTKFDVLTGLSDHTLGTTASIAAVALGACVIEKHFTLSRSDKGPDSEFSIEPDELKQLCKGCNEAWQSLGQGSFTPQPVEEKSRVFRRSIYFVSDLPAGSIVKSSDIRRIRPGLGLHPKFYNQLVGKKLKVDVQRGMATSWEVFDE